MVLVIQLLARAVVVRKFLKWPFFLVLRRLTRLAAAADCGAAFDPAAVCDAHVLCKVAWLLKGCVLAPQVMPQLLSSVAASGT